MEPLDHFSLLGEPRRPWIDSGHLKQKFLALSAKVHPDRRREDGGSLDSSADFANLNAAYQCLLNPKRRLFHLLALETGSEPAHIQEIPSEMIDLFVEFSDLCRATDTFLADRSQTASPLLRAEQFEAGMGWTERLHEFQTRLSVRLERLSEELKALNAVWEERCAEAARTEPLPLAELERIARLYGFLSRWSDKIQERIVQLSL